MRPAAASSWSKRCVLRATCSGAAAGLYFFEVAPRLATALAGRAELYDFLTASTRALGSADDVAAHLRAAGFGVDARRRFACGVVAGFVAVPA